MAQIALHAHKKSNLWIIDNGYSSHMTRDKSKFMNFKDFDGEDVIVNNNYIARIVSKGTLSLDGGKTRTYNILYVKV